jgi:hypothetical protein
MSWYIKKLLTDAETARRDELWRNAFRCVLAHVQTVHTNAFRVYQNIRGEWCYQYKYDSTYTGDALVDKAITKECDDIINREYTDKYSDYVYEKTS